MAYQNNTGTNRNSHGRMEMSEHKNIARFPEYIFRADGVVVSLTRRNPFAMRPIQMGKYVGLHLRRSDGTREKQYLHRLIAEAFHGECPAGMVCCHIDGDRKNNSAANLMWATQSENNLHKRAHGTAPVGDKNPMARLTWAAVQEMRDVRAREGLAFSEIASRFDVSTMTAYRAVVGQSWRTQ